MLTTQSSAPVVLDIPISQPAEITLGDEAAESVHSNIEASLDAKILEAVAAARGCFAGYDAKAASLAPTYVLFIHLLRNPAALIAALEHAAFAKRTRKISKSKPALIAMQLVLQPEDEDGRKSCSAWSKVLQFAEQQGVEVAEFTTWARDVTLDYCADQTKKQRPRNPAKNQLVLAAPLGGEAADSDVFAQGTMSLEFLYGGRRVTLPVPFPESATRQLDTLLTSNEVRDGCALLREIASLLDAARDVSTECHNALMK